MKICPECLNKVVDVAIACKYCGYSFDQPEPGPEQNLEQTPGSTQETPKTAESTNDYWKFLSVVILLAVVVSLIILFANRNTQQRRVTSAASTAIAAIPTSTRTLWPTAKPYESPTPDTRSDYERCADPKYKISYLLHGTAKYGGITWQNDTNGTEQGSYDVPFCISSNRFESGDFVYISIQIESQGGDVTCEIRNYGQLIAQGHASGFANIATCSGSVP